MSVSPSARDTTDVPSIEPADAGKPPLTRRRRRSLPSRLTVPVKLPEPINPALIKHAEEQATSVQNLR